MIDWYYFGIRSGNCVIPFSVIVIVANGEFNLQILHLFI